MAGPLPFAANPGDSTMVASISQVIRSRRQGSDHWPAFVRDSGVQILQVELQPFQSAAGSAPKFNFGALTCSQPAPVSPVYMLPAGDLMLEISYSGLNTPGSSASSLLAATLFSQERGNSGQLFPLAVR